MRLLVPLLRARGDLRGMEQLLDPVEEQDAMAVVAKDAVEILLPRLDGLADGTVVDCMVAPVANVKAFPLDVRGASGSLVMVTKAKPLDRPVSRSVMMLTVSTSPNCANRPLRSLSDV